MHNFDIIRNFDLRSLLSIMNEAGLPSVASKHLNRFDAARRTFSINDRSLSFNVFMIDEMLKFVGEVRGFNNDPQFIIEWNNISPIAPLIGLEDGAALIFDVNVRRSIPFGTFRKIANSFEDAMKRLDQTIPRF